MEQKSCNKCGSYFSEIDPHDLCKPCRQPDPLMFYCSAMCSACIEINKCHPLENVLRKYDFKKNTKNFSPPSNIPNCVPGSSREIVSLSNSSDYLSDFESRLIDKIMSRLSDWKANTSMDIMEKTVSLPKSDLSAKTPKVSIEVNKICNFIKQIDNDLSTTEKKYNASLIAFFKVLNPDSFIDNGKPDCDETFNSYIFKLSLRTSEILQSSTILSSPNHARKLIDELDVDIPQEIAWNTDVDISKLLNIYSDKSVVLKAHPKVRQMQNFLFGRLEFSLPKSIISPNFVLPSISFDLQNEFMFIQQQLQRLLLLSSVFDHYDGLKKLKGEMLAFTLLCRHKLEVCVINEANYLGILVRKIRKFLLKDAYCKVSGAIEKLVMGPIHSIQFFGPYVLTLQKLIEKYGPDYCIKPKKEINISVVKIPLQYFKSNMDPELSLQKLNGYFRASKTKENDRIIILKTLIPQQTLETIKKFVDIKDCSFMELADLFIRYSVTDLDILSMRFAFKSRYQLKNESYLDFAEALKSLVPVCKFGKIEKEMLRDQFIFGLSDKDLCVDLFQQPFLSFDECVLKAVKTKSNDEKCFSPPNEFREINKKRKISDLEESPVKSKVSRSYLEFLKPLPLDKSNYINILGINDWKKRFSLKKHYSYEIICPWTGRILRT